MEHTTDSPVAVNRTPLFERLGLYAVLGAFLLTPAFLVPSIFSSLQLSKIVLVALLMSVALVVFLFTALKRKEFRGHWSLLHIAVWVLPLVYLISSLFAANPPLSLFGYRLEPDTFGFILFGAFVTHLTALTLTKKSNALSALMALLIGAWIVFLFQLIQVIFGGPFPLFPDPSNNLVGRWNDFGIFAGLIGMLTLFTLESLSIPKRHRATLIVTFVLALLGLILVDMTEVWVLFGIVSFIALILGTSRRFFANEATLQNKMAGVFSGIAFVVAVFFLFFGGGLAGGFQQVVGVNSFDVRPSFQATVNILSASYADDPLFGSGPNTFNSAWLLHRGSGIVQTPFWNVSFNAGSSAVLSSAAVGGILVALGWLFMVLMIVFMGARALLIHHKQDPKSYFVVALSTLGMLYLLAVHLLYTPSANITLMLFLFIGLFLASIADTKLVRPLTIPFTNPRIGIAYVVVSAVLILFAVASLYTIGTKYLSVYHHNKAILTANQGDLESALRSVGIAVGFDEQDRYYRTATLIYIAQLNRIVQGGDSGESAQIAFQNTIASALQSANRALTLNPQHFQNYMNRGLVFESVVPLGIDQAFENASAMYEQARTVNPRDPEVDWRLAQMNVVEGNIEEARRLIESALSKKADYTNAIILLARIELDEGNLDEAIETVRAAVFFEPQNSVFLYQLGILLLQDNNYSDAAIAFEEALRLNPEFSNVSFFLSQAYAFLGEFEEAAQLMSDLAERNPDNDLVREYRNGLQEGVNPFDTTPVAPSEDEEIVE